MKFKRDELVEYSIDGTTWHIGYIHSYPSHFNSYIYVSPKDGNMPVLVEHELVRYPSYFEEIDPNQHYCGRVNYRKTRVEALSKQSEKDKGKKYDDNKPKWNLMPFHAADEVVKVLTYGAKKYGPDNWRKVEDLDSRYLAAALRHISAYAKGEEYDSESDLSHLSHAICSLMFLLENNIVKNKIKP